MRKSRLNAVAALALLAGSLIGAGGMQALHAQQNPRPLAHVIPEIELTNSDANAKEYVPLANKALAASGQKRLASGHTAVSPAGKPPAPRMVLCVFEDLDAIKAAHASPAYLGARKVGNQYARLRIFAVEGL
jgi:uncharacterized protein (DUF1330 family)